MRWTAKRRRQGAPEATLTARSMANKIYGPLGLNKRPAGRRDSSTDSIQAADFPLLSRSLRMR